MAHTATCDVCHADLLGRKIRYVAKLEVAQAYDPLEITPQDLRGDLRGELQALVRSLEKVTAAEAKRLEAEVYSSFRLDLCPACAARMRTDAAALQNGAGLAARLLRRRRKGRISGV